MALALALTRTMLSLPYSTDTAEDFGRAVRVAIRAASLSRYLMASSPQQPLAVVNSTPSFLQNRSLPGREWKMVGYLDMTDPTQQCPDSWQKITSPRSSCGKKSTAPCDSLNIATSIASYQTVCGRFRGYQIGSDDAFFYYSFPNIETHYVDGVSVTYGSPGSRHHVYTYAVGAYETNSASSCPCAGGTNPSPFVGSDYYCESGNPRPNLNSTLMYSSDVLWDRKQCGGDETTCCNPPDLPWFCKTFPNPISEDLEVRICTDQGFNDESMAIESFELYIEVNVSWDQLPSVSGNSYIAHEVRYSWPMGNGQLGTMYVNTSVYAQVPQPPEVQTSALMATSANLTWSCPLEKIYTVISYSVNVTANDPSSISANCVHGLNLSYYTTVPEYQRYIRLKDMSLGPTKYPNVWFFRVSTATNIENHQNDAILSQFQDEVYNAVNSSNYIPQTEKAYLEIACTSVPIATQMVDQSASNLAVVTTVITQISNVTLSSPDVPISNKY
eukprot:Em0001g3514a